MTRSKELISNAPVNHTVATFLTKWYFLTNPDKNTNTCGTVLLTEELWDIHNVAKTHEDPYLPVNVNELRCSAYIKLLLHLDQSILNLCVV